MSIVPVPRSIGSFRDALGLALELSEEFAFANAAAVIDRHHRCLDVTVMSRIGQGTLALLSWLASRVDFYPPRSKALLVTVRSVDGLSIQERDLADYRFARRSLDRLGLTLLDWIETDGDLVRSYAYLVNPGTDWAVEAAAEGALDCSDW